MSRRAMSRRALGCAATAALLVGPAPHASASHVTGGCRLTAVARASTGSTSWNGTVFGYVQGAQGEAVSVRCVVKVNGVQRATTVANSGTTVAWVTDTVWYNRGPADSTQVCAVYTSSHGTEERCADGTAFEAGTPPLGPDDPTIECRLQAVTQSVLTGRDVWEGVAEGVILGAVGEPVSIRCVVKVNGGIRAATDWGTGTTLAASASRVTYTRAATESIAICAQYVTSRGTGERCDPNVVQVALPDVTPVAACRVVSVQQDTLTGADTYEGVAFGFVLAGRDESVSVRCVVKVGGGVRAATDWASGTTFAFSYGRSTFTRAPSETAFICAQYTTSSGPGESCEPI